MRPAVRGGALCLLLALLCAPWALADIPQSPAEAFYVNDFANVIDASDEERMLALGAALEDETTAQAVVVTVDFLDGMTIEDYAYELFNLWGIGQEDANNGVLLLLSLGEREIRAEIGEGLEEKLTPSAAMRIVDDYAMDALREDDYSTGLRAAYEALCAQLASIYGVSLDGAAQEYAGSYAGDGAYVAGYPYEDEGGFDLMDIVVAVVILAVILAIVGAASRARHGAAPGCLFGWMLGRASRPGHRRPPRRPPPGPGGFGGPRPPRGPRHFGGGFGGFGGFGGGRPGGCGGFRGPRGGGGGRSRGAGGSRKF